MHTQKANLVARRRDKNIKKQTNTTFWFEYSKQVKPDVRTVQVGYLFILFTFVTRAARKKCREQRQGENQWEYAFFNVVR